MQSHKTLLAWQKARVVTKAVVELSASSWKPQLSAVFSQLQRSSLSVQVNIAEGYAFASSGRLRNHLRIAYASSVETGDLLDLLMDYDCDRQHLEVAIQACESSRKMLFGLMKRYGALVAHGESKAGRI